MTPALSLPLEFSLKCGSGQQHYTGTKALFTLFPPQIPIFSSESVLLFIQNREKLAFMSASILPKSIFITSYMLIFL